MQMKIVGRQASPVPNRKESLLCFLSSNAEYGRCNLTFSRGCALGRCEVLGWIVGLEHLLLLQGTSKEHWDLHRDFCKMNKEFGCTTLNLQGIGMRH
jgi:hypothetical protein